MRDANGVRTDPRRSVHRGVATTMACALLLYPGLSEQAETDDEVADSPVAIQVGVREDAIPFSYRKPTSASETVLAGFGGFTVEVCRHVLKQMTLLPEYRHLRFRAHVTSARDRFKKLDEEKGLFMLCGPDSITSERLSNYRASHFVFESGMTYAYVNPRSPNFPRDDHCGHVIGVVRGTTADVDGLADIANRDLLMRFDEALDLELSNIPKKQELATAAMKALVDEERASLIREWKKLGKGELKGATTEAREAEPDRENDPDREKELAREEELKRKEALEKEIGLLDKVLAETDPNRLSVAIDNLPDKKLSGRINKRMSERWRQINQAIARSIVTDECPQGRSSLPVRKYATHNEGIERFCAGEVLYYLGDYDIINEKRKEFSDCDVVMNRFTRSKEVYGVFFSKAAYHVPGSNTPETDADAEAPEVAMTGERGGESSGDDGVDAEPIDVARFYATFNNLLLLSMQGKESAIEQIFSREFAGKEKSEELDAFFDSFKISSFEE